VYELLVGHTVMEGRHDDVGAVTGRPHVLPASLWHTKKVA
jgi:hypothetical protein